MFSHLTRAVLACRSKFCRYSHVDFLTSKYVEKNIPSIEILEIQQGAKHMDNPNFPILFSSFSLV